MWLVLLLASVSVANACSFGDMKECTVTHGSGYQNCATGSWSKCVVAMCDIGYYIGGIADCCAPVGGSCSSGGGPKTVTVTATRTSGDSRPAPTQTHTSVTTTSSSAATASSATSTSTFSDTGTAQQDSYCQSASLQFANAVSFFKSGDSASGLASYAEGQELLRRAQRLGGSCAASTLDTYLSANELARKAAQQLEKGTGLKAKTLAEFTHEQADLAGTAREPTANAGARLLLQRVPDSPWRAASLSGLDKLGEKSKETATGTDTANVAETPITAEPVLETGGSGTTPSAVAEFPVSQKPNLPSAPTKMAENTMLELKELQLMLGSAAAGEPAIFEQKLKDFSLFTRVRLKYRQYHPMFGHPAL